MAAEEKSLVVWGSEQAGVPDFLRTGANEGYEEVKSGQLTSIYRVAQGLSEVVSDKKVELGHFYETQDQVDLGEERVIVIFKTRNVRELMNPEGKSTACKAYQLDDKGHGVGRIRLLNKEDMPPEYLEGWNLTPEEIENNRVFEMPCNKCPFADWKDELDEASGKKKRVPPLCKLGYEIYFLDITEVVNGGAFEDRIPHRIDIFDRNEHAKESIKNIQSLLTKNLKLNGMPPWAGAFRVKAVQKSPEGKPKAKFYVPVFEFLGTLPAELQPIFEQGRRYWDEFNQRQEQLDAGETQVNRASDGTPDDAGSAANEALVMNIQDASTPWSTPDAGATGTDGSAGSTPWS